MKNLIVTVTSSLNFGACSSISAVGFYQKRFQILSHPYLKAHLGCYRKKNPVDKLADAADLLQPVVVTSSGHLKVGE